MWRVSPPLREVELRPYTCCFTGHRDLSAQELSLLPDWLDEALEALYQRGVRRFFCGGARGFDLLAAERVLTMRQRCPDTQLLMALPCADQARRWPEAERIRQRQLCGLADTCLLLSPHYYPGCMMVRNRYMVDRSAWCLCWLTQHSGGTLSTVTYAVREELTVLNLAVAAERSRFLAETVPVETPLPF